MVTRRYLSVWLKCNASHLKRYAPERMETDARIHNAIGVGGHEIENVRSGRVQLSGRQRFVVDGGDETHAHLHRDQRHAPIEVGATNRSCNIHR